MHKILKEKLWAYIVHNNPDLMFNLQEDYSVTRYLDEKVNGIMPMAERLLGEHKPLYVIEELCIKEMTEELRPSRFLYLREVLEQEFPDDWQRLREDGLLTYEIINMMESCREIYESFNFSVQNEDDQLLRAAIIGQVHEYLV
ncbi:hypothetical protein [Sphingobacterium multivorum]|uniref:hypothetical protein n=1 Tax=Sphingobacterium multivorum TaxID=28454 RepID=UPI000E04C9F7|nr:hypothetical protein [Sphingobacterium multivorum]QQT46053.1 hypothetical protein I6J00_05125 [Sphingobacterium multivorum]SUJ30620.1 Uncharacterised protein [Sphingobacterium multivorum]